MTDKTEKTAGPSVYFRPTQELLDKIDALAKKEDRTRSQMIRILVRYGLDEVERRLGRGKL